MPIEGFSTGNNQQEQDNTRSNKNQEHKEGIPVTSVEAYLEMLKHNPPTSISEAEAERELSAIRAKISGELKNKLHEQAIEELKKQGLIEVIGYYAKDNDLSRDEYMSYARNGYMPRWMEKYNDQNEVVGHIYYEDKTEEIMTQEEIAIKYKLADEFNAASDHIYDAIDKELNNVMEEKVRKGELVFLGRKHFQEYLDMSKRGLPHDALVIRIHESDPSPSDSIDYYYGRIK